jgi:hypothetical protein
MPDAAGGADPAGVAPMLEITIPIDLTRRR